MLGLVYAGTLASGITLLAVSLAATPLSGWWVANLLTNFRPQFALLGLVVLALGLAIRTSHVAAIGAAIVAVNAAVVAAGVWPASSAGASPRAGPVLRVMTLNLLFSNRNADAVFRYVDAVRPDVLLLQEVNAFWADALQRLRDRFPYRVELPRVDAAVTAHGVVLLSRYRILEHDQLLRAPRLAQFAAARIAVEGCSVWVGSVHLVKPTGPVRLALQQRQFEQLATWVNARDGPLVLGGDLNATSYSPQVQRFLAATGLQLDQQAKPSQAFAATYPAALPLLGLKLDHLLVRDVVMPRVWTASPFGSDHRAVVADVVLPPPSGSGEGA